MSTPSASNASESSSTRGLTVLNPPHLHDPSPNGYSTAVVAPPNARIAFISGQGGQNGSGGLSPDFAVQVDQAYANLKAVLEALGAKPNQVAKLTVYVVDHDMSKLGVLTKKVTEDFAGSLPAQTLVPVPRLAVDGMLFEVEATAILGWSIGNSNALFGQCAR